jgi:hypothetical protein
MSPSLIPVRNIIPKVQRDPSFDAWPPPHELGAPAKYDRWREFQIQAAVSVVDSPYRFVAQCAPTGFGKSMVNMMCAIIPGKRMAYLTATKGLQTQLNGDWADAGLVDIRGMGNYKCIAASPGGEFYDNSLPSTGPSIVYCDEGTVHSRRLVCAQSGRLRVFRRQVARHPQPARHHQLLVLDACTQIRRGTGRVRHSGAGRGTQRGG